MNTGKAGGTGRVDMCKQCQASICPAFLWTHVCLETANVVYVEHGTQVSAEAVDRTGNGYRV